MSGQKKTVVRLHDGILYSREKKELLPFAMAYMKLETIKLSEINQSANDKYHMISLIRMI